MNLGMAHAFVRNETYWAIAAGAYSNLRTITFLGCGQVNVSSNFVCGRRHSNSEGCAPNGTLDNWCAPQYMVVNGTGDTGCESLSRVIVNFDFPSDSRPACTRTTHPNR